MDNAPRSTRERESRLSIILRDSDFVDSSEKRTELATEEDTRRLAGRQSL